MKQALNKEPKPLKTFRDNYLAVAMMVAALLISTISSAQTDSLRYSQINGYGFKYKRHIQDSVAAMPLSSSPHIPYRMGGYRYNDTCICMELWTGTQWVKSKGSQNLQQVTDVGNKTTDTVAVGGVRTKNILTDTTDKPTFRIILKPDTQNEVRYSWPYQLDSVAKWIRDSSAFYNTKAFLGLGDITDLGNTTEFSRMDSFYRHIDTAGLVYMPILGNHDYDNFTIPNVTNRLTTIYNTYFGPSRFVGKSWYGGNFYGINDNFYTKFEAEGHKFLVIGLEYNPRDSSLEWAQKVCDTFPDRETIIITHAYITAYNEKSTDTSSNTMSYGDIGNTGQEIWDKFIKKNKQIFLVAAGHYVHGGANLPAFGRIIQAGQNGNVVTQILSNYQSDTLDGYASGEGFLMTLDFDLRGGKINFNVYSPFLKKYHPAFVPFSIDYPSVNVEASVGVSSVNGNFNVAGPATLDSTVHITQLTKNRLMVTGKNGMVDTLENVAANSFLASTGVTTRPRYRTLLSTDIPAGSSNYIQNQIAAGQTSNFWAYNPTFPDFTGVGVISKTATYRTTVTSGVPMTLIVAHAGSNYGLGIQRASANVSPAHLSFFKNNGADFTTLVANGVGDQIGAINWHAVTAGLGVTLPASLHAYIERNDATAVTTGLVFNTKDSANVTRSTYLNSRGNLLLGGSSPSNAYRLRVNGPVAFDLGSDANYDTYYRDAAGAFVRLPAGTDGYVLTTHSTTSAPTWAAPGGGTTPGIDDVLAQAQTVTATRTIDIVNNDLNITGSSGDVLGISPSEIYDYKDFTFGSEMHFETAAGVLATNVPVVPILGDQQYLIVDTSTGQTKRFSRTTFAQTSTATVSGTTSETFILNSGVGTTTIIPEDFPVGKSYRALIKGVLSTDAAGSVSINFRLKLGSVTIATTGNIFNSASVTNRAYELEAVFTVRTTGASGTIMCMGMYQDENDGATKFDNGTSTSTIDMTTSQALSLTAQWNNANAGNSVSTYIVTLEPIN